jgi:NMT1-like family protein
MKVILGFMPLLDCASLVVAAERGFAAEEGLELALVRETSWANIRDRVVIGHFGAAHMLGPMTVASTLAIGHVRVPIIAPFALGLGGNAITVSLRMWEQMTREGATAGAEPGVHATALGRVVLRRSEPLTFAMVYPFSCHNYELRYWLAAGGIDPDSHVRLVVIPPPSAVQLEDFFAPARHNATFPWVSHALWFCEQMLRWKQVEFAPNHVAAVRATYRPDLYRAALMSINPDIPMEDTKADYFFDGQTFDPRSFDTER